MTKPSSFAEYSRRLHAFIEREPVVSEPDFVALASELFALQFARVAPYRQLCEARRITPDSLKDWRQIPAVPTAAFKELEFTSLAPNERTAVFHSSGTTGHRPSRHFHSAESLAVYEASLLPWFARHLAERADEVDAHPSGTPGQTRPIYLCLAPPPGLAPHSSLVHMFHCVSREFGGADSRCLAGTDATGAWHLDFAATFAALHRAEQVGQPLVLLGTAFMFVHLLDELEQRAVSFTLPLGSRVMETGGYKGRSRELPKPELHARLAARLGLSPDDIVCEYGMSELSSQAYSLTTNHAPLPFHFPPWCRARVVSPESGREVADGETGLLRIFDLANVRSVLALQTEDLAVRCGAGFMLLGRARQAEARGCSLLAA